MTVLQDGKVFIGGARGAAVIINGASSGHDHEDVIS